MAGRSEKIAGNATFGLDFSKDRKILEKIIMNPKKMNFKELFKSEDFNKLVGTYFKDMFESGNDGKWKITSKWSSRKKALGYDPRPNIMTRKMFQAMAHPVVKSSPVSNALRETYAKSMRWGINTDAADFQSNGGSYPERVAKKNPFAFMTDTLQDALAEMTAIWLLKQQKTQWQENGI